MFCQRHNCLVAEHGGRAFLSQPAISTAADKAESAYAGDLNGDGEVDVLSASFGDDKMAWYASRPVAPSG